MNKLKEIGNKYYQEVEVVMLATDKNRGIYSDNKEKGKLFNNRNYYSSFNIFISSAMKKIKEWNWYLDIESNRMWLYIVTIMNRRSYSTKDLLDNNWYFIRITTTI